MDFFNGFPFLYTFASHCGFPVAFCPLSNFTYMRLRREMLNKVLKIYVCSKRRWFPIFERSQVLLLRIKLLFNKRLGKTNNNLLPNFSPTLPKHCQLLYIFIVNWIPMREQRKFAKNQHHQQLFIYSWIALLYWETLENLPNCDKILQS